MAVEREVGRAVEIFDPFTGRINWRAGAVAGFVAAVVMGAAISIVQLDTLRIAIAGLYGLEGNLVAGWLLHLLHGTLFGVLFAAILSDPGLYRITDWWWKTLVAALIYALVLAVVGAGFVMPIWLEIAGIPWPGPFPNLTVPLVAWHLVYGLALGIVYPLAESALEKRADAAPK